MVMVRVGLRLRFTKVPGIQGERVFRETVVVNDPHDYGYHDISSIVERKLRFMDVPPCSFTVFHIDSKTGDMLVVDDAYLGELMGKILEDATAAAATVSPSGEKSGNDNDIVHLVEEAVSFLIEVGRVMPVDTHHRASEGGIVPLTSEALQAHTASDVVHVPIGALTCPPKYPRFFVRGVVIAVRVKTPKPSLSVCEIDLCDTEDAQQQITSVTFDATVQKGVQEILRCDRKQVVELRNVYVRVKNENDRRFQTNTHPLLIRMDRGSKIEVVQVLSVPIAPYSERVVTVRENLRPPGFVSLGDLAALRDSHDTHASPTLTRVESTTGSSSSSSMHSGARRTIFSFARGGDNSDGGAPASGVVSSLLGEQVRQKQAQFLSKRRREEPVPWEPDTLRITTKDVRMRDTIVEQQVLREDDKKERIRRRKEVSHACIICGVNCEDDSTLCVVEDLLRSSYRNMGQHIPSMAELRRALCDRRLTRDGKRRSRLVCSEHFVDLRMRTLHVVHCRCVHLCSGYQKGSKLEDVVFCDLPMQICHLCGMPGASVSCYHPDCNEMYHTVCALFSDGYVNFGKKDPYLPCPACPRHTQVNVSTANGVTADVVSGGQGATAAAWWEEDEVVFDSRVVEDTDLRDPDENDGV